MLHNPLQTHLKLLEKKAIQKTAKSTGDFVANKFADQIAKVFISSQIKVQKQLKAKQKYQYIYIYIYIYISYIHIHL